MTHLSDEGIERQIGPDEHKAGLQSLPGLLPVALIVFYALATRLAVIDAPFSHNPEGAGAFYGQLARGLLKYPWSISHGLAIMTIGYVPGVAPAFYAHHPPLIIWMIAVSYRLFGFGDWQTRLPFALCTLGCVLLLYAVFRRLGQPRAGVWAAGLFAAMPMVLFYGGFPEVVGTPLVLFCLLTLAAYVRFHERPTWRNWLLLLLAFIPAGLTDWPAYYLLPVLLGHFMFTQPARKWGWIIGFCAAATGLFAAAYVHIVLGAHQPWDWILAEVRRRSVSEQGDRGRFTFIKWLAGVWKFNLHRHTWVVLLLAAGWVMGFSWRRGMGRAVMLTRLTFAWAAVHISIGRQGVYVHDWWWFPLTPALAMAGGLLLSHIKWQAGNAAWARVTAVLAGIAFAAFAIWTAGATLPRFYQAKYTHGHTDFSPREFGQAIRLASPDDNHPVLIAYNDEYDLPLWYYGDRPLRFGVWSVGSASDGYDDPTALADRLADHVNDLPFGFKQKHWPIPPAGLVYPKSFVAADRGFVEYLKKEYRMTETERFLIFHFSGK